MTDSELQTPEPQPLEDRLNEQTTTTPQTQSLEDLDALVHQRFPKFRGVEALLKAHEELERRLREPEAGKAEEILSPSSIPSVPDFSDAKESQLTGPSLEQAKVSELATLVFDLSRQDREALLPLAPSLLGLLERGFSPKEAVEKTLSLAKSKGPIVYGKRLTPAEEKAAAEKAREEYRAMMLGTFAESGKTGGMSVSGGEDSSAANDRKVVQEIFETAGMVKPTLVLRPLGE